jgi:hypothetical protein
VTSAFATKGDVVTAMAGAVSEAAPTINRSRRENLKSRGLRMLFSNALLANSEAPPEVPSDDPFHE